MTYDHTFIKKAWLNSNKTLLLEYFSTHHDQWMPHDGGDPLWNKYLQYRINDYSGTKSINDSNEQEWAYLAISKGKNNGGETDYYALPEGCKTLNDLIEYKSMQPWQHEVIKAVYALDERAKKNGGSRIREINKIIYYANRGLAMEKR